jgi:hypothetical protein
MPHLKLVCLGPRHDHLPCTPIEVLDNWQARLGPRFQALTPAAEGGGDSDEGSHDDWWSDFE